MSPAFVGRRTVHALKTSTYTQLNMKLKQKLILPVLGMALATGVHAATGIFGSFVNITTNSADAWYNLHGSDGGSGGQTLADFDGHDFGSFDPTTDSMTITGAEGLVWKNNDNIDSVSLYYRVRDTSGAYGNFSKGSINWTVNEGANGFSDAAGKHHAASDTSENQKWSNGWQTVDLLAGRSPGSYEVQMYLEATSDSGAGTKVHDNNGSYYTATFTVTAVPEPSSAALLGLGGLALILRRRK